jgi:hypothetical protein
MKKTLTFSVAIAAPRPVVWETMLGQQGYKAWTAAFCDGSHYKGSWEKGSPIRFLAPNGDGMVAEIADNKRHEFISIRHLGETSGGVDDTTSEKVRAWAPAYENYTFVDANGGTEVSVSVETVPDYVEYMNTTYPKALQTLKDLCEAKRA